MLRISKRYYNEVIAHCRSAYPKEACGILAGAVAQGLTPNDQRRVVVAVYPMRNVEDSPIGYAMDPKEQLAVEKQMRVRGQHMLGVYHSHTASEAYPSSVDVSLAISPDVSYVLISLKDQRQPIMKSYRIEGAAIQPEAVEVGERGFLVEPSADH